MIGKPMLSNTDRFIETAIRLSERVRDSVAEAAGRLITNLATASSEAGSDEQIYPKFRRGGDPIELEISMKEIQEDLDAGTED